MAPIVPKSTQGDRIAEAVPLGRVQAEDVGLDAIAQGLGAAGDAVGGIAIDMKRRTDMAMVTDALVGAEARALDAWHNAETGLLNRRGLQAIGGDGSPDVASVGRDSLARIRSEFAGKLRQGVQTEAFERAWGIREARMVAQLQRHAAREMSAYEALTNQAFLKVAADRVARADTNDDRTAAMAEIVGKIDELGDAGGWDENTRAVQVQEVLSPALATSIQRLATVDHEGARELLERFQSFIHPARLGELAKSVELDGIRGQAQRVTDSIVAGLPTLDARLAAARAVEDPKLRDEVVKRVKTRTNEEAFAARQKAEADTDASWERLLDGGGEAEILPGVPVAQRRRMLEYLDKRIAKQARGEAFVDETDPATWRKLVRLRRSDPQSFAKTDLWQHREKLARPDFRELQEAQKELRSPTKFETTRALKDGDIAFARRRFRSAKIENETEIDLMLDAFERAARQEREVKGRDLSVDEREEIIKRTISERILVPGAFGWTFAAFGETKRVGELTPADTKALLRNPPTEVRTQALRALVRRGVEQPTEDQVRDTIAGMLRRLGAPAAAEDADAD
ncbi:MAG: hypothetical protein NXI30_04665 [bacterium]|nr:hypothetical protein [bacterium]